MIDEARAIGWLMQIDCQLNKIALKIIADDRYLKGGFIREAADSLSSALKEIHAAWDALRRESERIKK
ncbi:MAG: hypothetical protein LBO72_07350 [Helicobacteraceae bacterium]|jgi:hypothetical protein|nr:hypothetical protein [Helicobacteraceae bacterium]